MPFIRQGPLVYVERTIECPGCGGASWQVSLADDTPATVDVMEMVKHIDALRCVDCKGIVGVDLEEQEVVG